MYIHSARIVRIRHVNSVSNKKRTFFRSYLLLLLYCPLLREVRIESYNILKDTVENYIGVESWKDSFSAKEDTVQLIVGYKVFENFPICLTTKRSDGILRNYPEICVTNYISNVYLSYEIWLPGTCHLI